MNEYDKALEDPMMRSIIFMPWKSDNVLDKIRYAVHLAFNTDLRQETATEYKEMWLIYLSLSSENSKYCPRIYLTCDNIIERIKKDEREPKYTRILKDFEHTARTYAQREKV
jgi:hypothetical protein